jgi:hypothetical protein
MIAMFDHDVFLGEAESAFEMRMSTQNTSEMHHDAT